MNNIYKTDLLFKVLKRVLLFVLIFTVALEFYAVSDQSRLVVTEYNYKTEKTDASFKFVLLADLHNKQFGNDNDRLVAKVRAQDPEFIVIAGDMVVKTSDDISVAVGLVRRLSEIAPVYYTYGNHEQFMEALDPEPFLAEAGAIMLNNKMVKYTVDGDEIIIGGLKQYPFYEFDAPNYENEERYFFDDFLEAQKDEFSLLICHYPEAYCWGLKEYNIDLMLAAHAHGGIIRLPFLGGMYVPDRGWFGGYDKGFYSTDTATMLVTTGLGQSNSVPRINNPPEICVVNINPNK